MKISITFVLGMIICNFVCIKGDGFDEYCIIPKPLRGLVWDCIYRYLPQNEKTVFRQISECFGVSTFDKVFNLLCGLSDDEINDLRLQHELCLSEIDFSNIDGLTVSESDTESCIQRKLG